MLCVRLLFSLPYGKIRFSREFLRPQFTLFFTKSFSSAVNNADEESFVVSYLVSSCGLSTETAIAASKRLHFRSVEQPDSVLTTFRKYGFTDTHIFKLIRSRPTLLLSSPENTLVPKLEFLRKIGIPNSDIPKIFSSHPCLFNISLKNRILPMYKFLRTVICLDDKKLQKAFKMSGRLFEKDLEKYVVPRIEFLTKLGVSKYDIAQLISCFPHVLLHNQEQFENLVKGVIEMGISPLRAKFIHVLSVMCRLSKSTWEHKMEVYRKWGWSDDDIRAAFIMQPICMAISEKKIMSTMDFLVNKMGWKPTAIAEVPTVLLYSLQKRIIPRCMVIKVLISKGLIKKDVASSTLLILGEEKFTDKFVTQYESDVPQLLSIFRGKLNPNLSELGFESVRKAP